MSDQWTSSLTLNSCDLNCVLEQRLKLKWSERRSCRSSDSSIWTGDLGPAQVTFLHMHTLLNTVSGFGIKIIFTGLNLCTWWECLSSQSCPSASTSKFKYSTVDSLSSLIRMSGIPYEQWIQWGSVLQLQVVCAKLTVHSPRVDPYCKGCDDTFTHKNETYTILVSRAEDKTTWYFYTSSN